MAFPLGLQFIPALMFSTNIFIAFAVVFFCVGRGLDTEHKSALEAVVKCFTKGWYKDASFLKAIGGHTDKAEKVEEACIFFKVKLQLRSHITS